MRNLKEDTRRDYEASYAKGNDGPFEEIWKEAQKASNAAGANRCEKPAVKSTPGHFKFNDGGNGPIPTTGVGRRDYNVKYSRTGSLTEQVSPALKEALHDHAVIRELRRNHLIEDTDLDIFFDKEHLD